MESASENYPNDSVIINKFALGKEELSQKSFFSHDISSGISGFHKINLQSKDSINWINIKKDKKLFSEYRNSVNHESTVEVKRLDNYIKDKNLDKVNLLKMDTQGFEPEIICGLSNQLRKVDVILTEIMFYDLYEKKISFYSLKNS